MSDDLIRRSDAIEALKNALCELGGDEWGDGELGVHADDIDAVINGIPTIEPKRGKWIETSEGTMCSNCHEFPYDDGEYHIANWYSDFCPHCGARMKGANDE